MIMEMPAAITAEDWMGSRHLSLVIPEFKNSWIKLTFPFSEETVESQRN